MIDKEKIRKVIEKLLKSLESVLRESEIKQTIERLVNISFKRHVRNIFSKTEIQVIADKIFVHKDKCYYAWWMLPNTTLPLEEKTKLGLDFLENNYPIDIDEEKEAICDMLILFLARDCQVPDEIIDQTMFCSKKINWENFRNLPACTKKQILDNLILDDLHLSPEIKENLNKLLPEYKKVRTALACYLAQRKNPIKVLWVVNESDDEVKEKYEKLSMYFETLRCNTEEEAKKLFQENKEDILCAVVYEVIWSEARWNHARGWDLIKWLRKQGFRGYIYGIRRFEITVWDRDSEPCKEANYITNSRYHAPHEIINSVLPERLLAIAVSSNDKIYYDTRR